MPDPTDPYTTVPDVVLVLGKIGPRLPAEIDVAAFVDMAHADVVDRLADVYTHGIPAFDGDGLQAVRWAEAKLAAAEILGIVRNMVNDVGDAPALLRAEVERTLAGGIVGYPPGSYTNDPNVPGVPVTTRPQVSSATPTSMFPDPYEDRRGDPLYPFL